MNKVELLLQARQAIQYKVHDNVMYNMYICTTLTQVVRGDNAEDCELIGEIVNMIDKRLGTRPGTQFTPRSFGEWLAHANPKLASVRYQEQRRVIPQVANIYRLKWIDQLICEIEGREYIPEDDILLPLKGKA